MRDHLTQQAELTWMHSNKIKSSHFQQLGFFDLKGCVPYPGGRRRTQTLAWAVTLHLRVAQHPDLRLWI